MVTYPQQWFVCIIGPDQVSNHVVASGPRYIQPSRQVLAVPESLEPERASAHRCYYGRGQVLLQRKARKQRGKLTFVTVRHHSLDTVHIRAEAPHLHLLALARLNRQGIRIYPLASGNFCRVRGVCEDIEHRGFLDDGKVRDHGDDLLEDSAYFGLYLGIRLGRAPARHH